MLHAVGAIAVVGNPRGAGTNGGSLRLLFWTVNSAEEISGEGGNYIFC
jgi:hypothetical protein